MTVKQPLKGLLKKAYSEQNFLPLITFLIRKSIKFAHFIHLDESFFLANIICVSLTNVYFSLRV